MVCKRTFGEMMSGRLQTVQLTIQHVRNDRERVPVTTDLCV